MDRLSAALDSFRCYRDMDIEAFLRQHSLQFLARGWCAIYLILDEQAFDSGNIEIDAYFTLSHKYLIPENVSKARLKRVSGFSDAESVHFVLIGQLGKYMEQRDDGGIVSAGIKAQEILDYAFEIVRASSHLIPCRCALVECGADKKIHKVYTDYNFTFFQHDGEHYQFYKRI